MSGLANENKLVVTHCDRSVMVTRMETLLHDEFGGEDYWMVSIIIAHIMFLPQHNQWCLRLVITQELIVFQSLPVYVNWY